MSFFSSAISVRMAASSLLGVGVGGFGVCVRVCVWSCVCVRETQNDGQDGCWRCVARTVGRETEPAPRRPWHCLRDLRAVVVVVVIMVIMVMMVMMIVLVMAMQW